jgi:hypothetical protein
VRAGRTADRGGLTWADTLVQVSGPSEAEIIETFLDRATRVVNSDLIDATKARIQRGYNINIQMDGDRHILVDHGSFNEYLIKGLAVDLRPFLPWVDDQVKISRVINAVNRSLTDPQWKRAMQTFKTQYGKMTENPLFVSMWSSPSEQWQMSVTDHQLAKMVINQQWFHEGMDPKVRETLALDMQQGANFHAVSKLLNDTVIVVSRLQKFIIDADDAGVLHPKTR